MKILWFVNITFPEIGKYLGKSYANTGGWMEQFKKALISEDNLAIACFRSDIKETIKENIGGIEYYIIPKKEKRLEKYDNSIELYIKNYLNEYKPDLVHIWGTEYPHSYAISKICNQCNIKYVVSIQGLISDIAKHYCEGLPFKIIHSYTLRDILRNDNIFKQKKAFERRGEFEILCIKNTQYVIGRTIYDYAGINEINSNIKYYFCNECLRDSFYEEKLWCLENVEKYSLFISQASYPIKGFHIFLEALTIVKRKYKNVRVYVGGGTNPFASTISDIVRQNSYNKYISQKIVNNNLTDNIIFLNNLNEQDMRNRMVQSHIFISPSLVENSPNSIGEAMILGTPVISSYVGGVSNMIEHNKSGLLYPPNQPNILAQYIIDIFENNSLANYISVNEKKKALEIYDIKKNTNSMRKIYKEIINSKIEGNDYER